MQIESFGYGFAFAFGMALVRFFSPMNIGFYLADKREKSAMRSLVTASAIAASRSGPARVSTFRNTHH